MITSVMTEPMAETADSVTLRRADYERLLDAYEDARDLKTFDRYAFVTGALGEEDTRRLRYTSSEVDRMLDHDVSPVTIWRERAGLTGRGLALEAGISPSYLAEIEGGKKPGSAAALSALARVLRVPMEHLVQG